VAILDGADIYVESEVLLDSKSVKEKSVSSENFLRDKNEIQIKCVTNNYRGKNHEKIIIGGDLV